ncbi:MAG: 50S ribosomal protein L11 methyltransferase, partial [Ignavibacteriaceae bacterium]
MKHYKEFIITAKPFAPDIISGILWDLNISGITEEENLLRVFADGKSDVNDLEIVFALQQLVENKMLIEFKVEEHLLKNKNWNEEWEKGINIIKVSDRIIIKPTFKKYKEKKGEIVITIDPKMSFGTGEHPTTRLVLLQLEKIIKKGEKVLDVGTGTGLLAIASIKLGADYAIAID